MLDQYGRKIEYLRISVTDRCNLRCVYCMPEEGVEQVSHSEILSFDEMTRICRICAKLGITRVKLTGGEPLVRKGLGSLLRSIKEIEGIEQVTLTTNGVLLAEQIEELAAAGLDAVNVSLDTLDRAQYMKLTRRDELEAALRGLEAALQYPDIRVKVNCVALHGENESQWGPLAYMAKERPIDVRFIEMMPIGLGKEYPFSSQELVYEALKAAFGEAQFLTGNFGNGPAIYARFPGFTGKTGFISAVSHKFCESCNRVRLTAEGFLKPCLQYSTGVDLRAMLRNEAGEKELEEMIQKVIFEKPRSHQFQMEGSSKQEDLEQKQMSSIGG
ncbi:GTP 3',8-cyclase MoaA [Faecalicatena orotica]|uniref:GTP 3',8-cyclase n=1 Tax=Faecalicatena orotica TaxID=1544 RepID=A0A2Y9BJJ0_9FIRM|nr:GTP 3',8-cyclase MoaA [Faecalicatena orotica]PWJ23505.1 cyclic pyranopterin phosphate synthase [Faecalicatena orotica]SSA57767.1 cyclic pyranopterin phosphate synthase [Faecalicatena orotica]